MSHRMSHSDLYIADNSTENQNVMIIISRMGISEGYLSTLLEKAFDRRDEAESSLEALKSILSE